MLCIMATYIIVSFSGQEKVVVYKGLGWDGFLYWKIISNYEKWLRNNYFNKYRVQRILPVSIIYSGIKSANAASRFFTKNEIDFSPNSVIKAFMIMNGLCIVLAAFYLLRIAEVLALSHRQKLMLIICTFSSFAFLKQLFYYPVLTDYMAFGIGTAMLYYYLVNSKVGVLITLVLGSFTFPNIIYCGSILYLFPYKTGSKKTNTSKIFSYLPAAFFILFTLYAALFELQTKNYFSLFLTLLYLWFAQRNTSEPKKWLFILFTKESLKRLSVLLFVVVLIKMVQFNIANEADGALTFFHSL